jgi:two-component sensor histidine kinase
MKGARLAESDAGVRGAHRVRPDPAPARDRGEDSYIARWLKSVAIGLLGAVTAVALRYSLPIEPEVLPFFAVVIAVSLVTVAAGLPGGITTTVVGGLLTWLVILGTPGSWVIGRGGALSLAGFFAVASVILFTSQMYRTSERRRQAHALDLARKEAENQRLFAREMAHRMKNTMAIVQSVAGQTFTHDSPDVIKFAARLTALADAQSLLNEHVKAPSANLRDLVEVSVRPFDDGDDRFALDGPDLPLRDQQAITLAMALHELATNAVKYGALCADAGRVTIDWRIRADRLELEWKEHGGPPVTNPAATGFGLRLLNRKALGSTVAFEPDGLRCSISQPLYDSPQP